MKCEVLRYHSYSDQDYIWFNNFFWQNVFKNNMKTKFIASSSDISNKNIVEEKFMLFRTRCENYRFYEKYFFSSSFNHLFVNSKNSISLLFPCVCKLLVGNGKVRYNIKANHAHTHNCNSCKHLWDMLCLSY